MSEIGFRDLSAEDIEVRVSTASEKGVSLLLYKDARCDMRILDEAVGVERWQREHYEVKGRMFCRVGVLFDDEWVWKADCGTESNTEAAKGEASDSFKRACFNWGIGRELYTAPYIWVNSSKIEIKKNKQGKFTCYERFFVNRLKIEDRAITAIEISTKHGVVFTRGYGGLAERHESRTQDAKPAEAIDPVKAAKTRLWRACQDYAKKEEGRDYDALYKESFERLDYEDTAAFYILVAEEFESQL